MANRYFVRWEAGKKMFEDDEAARDDFFDALVAVFDAVGKDCPITCEDWIEAFDGQGNQLPTARLETARQNWKAKVKEFIPRPVS